MALASAASNPAIIWCKWLVILALLDTTMNASDLLLAMLRSLQVCITNKSNCFLLKVIYSHMLVSFSKEETIYPSTQSNILMLLRLKLPDTKVIDFNTFITKFQNEKALLIYLIQFSVTHMC